MNVIAAITRYLTRVILLVLFICVSVYFLFATTAGADFIIRTSLMFFPGKISIGTIQGNLYHNIECQNIIYTNAQNKTQIDNINFVWHPLHLLDKKIVISQLDINGIDIHTTSTAKKIDAKPQNYLNYIGYLRFLYLNTVHIENVKIASNDQQYHIQEIMLARKAADRYQLQLTSSQGKLTGEYIYDATHWQFHLEGNGELNHLPVKGITQLTYNQGKLIIDPSSVHIGDTHLQFAGAGEITNNGDLDLHMQIGDITLSNLNLTLKEIKLDTQYHHNQPIIFSGNVTSGEGKAAIEGTIARQSPGMPIDLKLQGENIQVANLPEYKINATPHIQLNYYNQILSIKGTVDIPYAQLSPKDFASVNTLPSEVEFVNQPKTQSQTLLSNIEMKVQFNLEKNIYLAYENLSTHLAGNVTIVQRLGNLPNATGELYAINGKYQAYGKKFKVQNGRLIYAGNMLTNPGLDIRATQTIKKVKLGGGESQFDSQTDIKPIYLGNDTLMVGVVVKGTLKNPQMTLFSSATELSQGDILSYMLFGYPQSQIKDANKLTLLASTLNQGGGGGSVKKMTNKIKKILGLSEIDIGNKEYFDPEKNTISSNTSLTIGKQLGKKLSLQYSIGLFNPISIFNLRYQINKRLSIQSETSPVDTGADIIFEIERD